MRVAANENHTTVLIETSEGQPYCLMADHLLLSVILITREDWLTMTEAQFFGGFYKVQREPIHLFK